MSGARLGRRCVAVALFCALLLAACGGDAARPTDGGRDTLPGALEDGVTFDAAGATANAPAFKLSLLDGTTVEGATLWKDRPVVLFFFSSWCSKCAQQQKTLAPLASEYRDVVTFVGISGKDKPEAVRAWLRDHDVRYPVGIDLEVWRPYAVRTPPAVVLVAPGGKLVRGWPGGVDAETLADSLAAIVKR